MLWLRALFVLALLAPLAAQAGDTVGTAAAVNPAATGTPPNSATRTLLVGTDVVFKEKIRTEQGGQTQILFLDQSTVTVAPNSDLVLDEFVYDPQTSSGKLSISMGRGLLRFVGGAISKKAGVTIGTATANIVVRGGITMVQAESDRTLALNIFGQTIVQPICGDVNKQPCGQPRTIDKPGTLATVDGHTGS